MSDIKSDASNGAGSAGESVDKGQQLTQFQLVWRRFRRHRAAMFSLVVLVALTLFAFALPLVWPYDHGVYREIAGNQSPSWQHPFGTTNQGQDVFAQTMRGAQQSLKVALTVSVMATGFGALWGAIAGYHRGRIDAVMMRVTEIFLIIPLLVAVAALGGNLTGGTTWYAVALIIGLFSWASIARLVRGSVLSLREQEFIEAARASGASASWIILRHLLPNAAGPIIVAATLLIAIAVQVEAALSFLGFGIQPPDISLGKMVEGARTAAFTRPWLFYPPGLIIVAICLAINFIGDGLRDALDPRQTISRR
ncbi:ABC transporter permease [Nocardiopsis terrae]|uniref:Peptide/nickel transport system permease protein n=1 Tax=Nocardiopsis terrae TaxID=372655 RepID=A0ABR9HNF9_9ACTN|nr:ABC transporter permease [Nocardiopsis terrae]MBE1460564.1 peptide/nickel transport system permease protein [Nocardiopsis terrae]GHC72126.1 ABC transporter permease [Nocardiopsis terrae]